MRAGLGGSRRSSAPEALGGARLGSRLPGVQENESYEDGDGEGILRPAPQGWPAPAPQFPGGDALDAATAAGLGRAPSFSLGGTRAPSFSVPRAPSFSLGQPQAEGGGGRTARGGELGGPLPRAPSFLASAAGAMLIQAPSFSLPHRRASQGDAVMPGAGAAGGGVGAPVYVHVPRRASQAAAPSSSSSFYSGAAAGGMGPGRLSRGPQQFAAASLGPPAPGLTPSTSFYASQQQLQQPVMIPRRATQFTGPPRAGPQTAWGSFSVGGGAGGGAAAPKESDWRAPERY